MASISEFWTTDLTDNNGGGFILKWLKYLTYGFAVYLALELSAFTFLDLDLADLSKFTYKIFSLIILFYVFGIG